MAKTKQEAKKDSETESEGRTRHWLDNTFIKKVVAAKDDDEKTVPEIAKDLGVAKGQVALALLRGRVPVKQRQMLEDDPETLAKEVVRLRNDETLSWGVISAHLGVPESLVRTTFAETTGTDHKGNRIGKGGRHPGDVDAEKSPAAQKAKGAAKKGKPAAGGKVIPLPDMNEEQITERLTGKTVTVGRGAGKSKKHVVKSVGSLKKGELTFNDDKGAAHTIKVSDIVRATR